MEERSQQGKNVCAGCSLNIPARSTSYKHNLFWKKLLNHVTKLDLMHLLPGIHNIYKIQWIWNWKHAVLHLNLTVGDQSKSKRINKQYQRCNKN